jgi:cyclohexa-1,5-dienecarbonyl-CoA hydratase
MTGDRVVVKREAGRLRIVLDAPAGNAITDAMVAVMRETIATIGADTAHPAVKLVTIESAGKDFSFGSDLHEHTPDLMPAVLPRFHGLLVEFLRIPAVTMAVVRGRCLGGGFELALACDVMFASQDAVFALPEIGVAAFPPAASILLPLKAGVARATPAILSGRSSPAAEWQQAGVVHRIVPGEHLATAVDEWYESTIAPRSAAALWRAALASRLVILRAMDALLPQAERLYLNDLLLTSDAAEGVAAFLEKRPPRWTDS